MRVYNKINHTSRPNERLVGRARTNRKNNLWRRNYFDNLHKLQSLKQPQMPFSHSTSLRDMFSSNQQKSLQSQTRASWTRDDVKVRLQPGVRIERQKGV